jgi:hypothetical protein
MTTATVTNDRPQRKQLCDQIDRLDGILDALGEGLNSAIADAAREGTRLAVRDAIVEILTDPTLRTRLHEASAPEPPAAPVVPFMPKKPGLWACLKAKCGQAVAAVGQTASDLVNGAANAVQVVTQAATNSLHALQALGSLKKLVLVGVGVGMAVGAASFLAPHAVSAAVSGLGGAVAATAIQIGVWTRRVFRAFTTA